MEEIWKEEMCQWGFFFIQNVKEKMFHGLITVICGIVHKLVN